MFTELIKQINKYTENENIEKKILGDCTWVLPSLQLEFVKHDSPPQKMYDHKPM